METRRGGGGWQGRGLLGAQRGLGELKSSQRNWNCDASVRLCNGKLSAAHWLKAALGLEASISPSGKWSGRPPAAPGRRTAGASIRQEETLGPQDARGIGVKLCRAGSRRPEEETGTRAPRPLAPAARPPPPAPAAPARLRLGPSPLPPPARSALARSLAGSSSLARPRPAQLGHSGRGAERASAPAAPEAARPAAPSLAPASSSRSAACLGPRRPRGLRLRAPRSHDAGGPAARRGSRRALAAPRPAPGEPRGSSGGR